MPFSSVNEAPMRFSRTDWLSGGRAVGETREASQSRLRAASLCAGASRPSAGAGVRRRYGFLQFSLFSALKFVGCWSLEERNPRFHCLFWNMETLLRILRIPYRKPSHQLLLRHIEKMHFTTRPKLLGSQPEIFAFLSC